VASTAICSASATIRSLISLACSRACSAGRLGLLAALADVFGQPLQAHPETVEVAERVGLGDALEQALHAGRGLGRRHVGGSDPLLEQHHLGLEGLVLTLEKGDRLFRTTRLPRADHPLAVGGTDIDGPVGVYPAHGW